MTNEVFEYLIKRCEELGIWDSRGQYPNFETIEQVDLWIEMIVKSFND